MPHKIQAVPQVDKAKEEEKDQRRVCHRLPRQKQKALGPKEGRDELKMQFILLTEGMFPAFIVSRKYTGTEDTFIDHWLFNRRHVFAAFHLVITGGMPDLSLA